MREFPEALVALVPAPGHGRTPLTFDDRPNSPIQNPHTSGTSSLYAASPNAVAGSHISLSIRTRQSEHLRTKIFCLSL